MPPRAHRWWFFRRDEVDDLLADCDYARRRGAAQKGLVILRAYRHEHPSTIYSRYCDE